MAEGLAGKVAVVTGGATRIGRAVASGLAARGAQVLIAGRRLERGEAAVRAMARGGGRAVFLRADVGREADVRSVIERTVSALGGIDYLVNNAGIGGTPGPIGATTEEAVDAELAVNVKGVFLGMKHAVPYMAERGGGVVVNTGFFVGTTVPPHHAVICGAGNATLLSMTRSAAAKLAAENVRVYAVCPWIRDTPMVDRLAGHQVGSKARFGEMNTSGRMAEPEDIARVVLSLISGATDLESGGAILVGSGGATREVRPCSAAPTMSC